MEPTRIADTHCHTGEGPLWHPDEERVYWLDIPNGILYRYDPETGVHEQCYETSAIGGFTVQDDGSLLLFEDRGRVERWDDGDVTVVIDEIEQERDSRFNDVIADPEGRVYCGTMPTDDRGGRLYRLDTDGSITELIDDVAIPNGMGFTPDRAEFYFTETEANHIYRFAYDAETGELSEREVAVDTSDVEGNPDGMTVDGEGNLWVAFWNGGRVARYAPDGTEEARIELPAKKVSCPAFGGEDYADLFVTTALGPGEGDAGTRDEEGDGAGALFCVTPEVGGVPEFRSRVEY